MIGLGTNRLSASRLAGLGEARQFRVGQWLEGAGSWYDPSPYSAAATAALKAAFSAAQWAIIRDYGWEHPEIVGYMNAYAVEDAKIAMSLVPGIGWRYIQSSGTQYMDSGYVFGNAYSGSYSLEMQVGQLNTSASCWCGCEMGGSRHYFIFQQNANVNLWHMGNNGRAIVSSLTDGQPHIFKIVSGNGAVTVYKDGESKLTGTTSNVTCTNSFGLFCDHTPTYNQFATIRLGYCKIWEGDEIKREMYPFIRDNKNGMIDLVTGTFYENLGSGSFTISESPS